MSRKLKKNSTTRLVMTGTDEGPKKSWLEYRVQDGDMAEPPGRHDYEDMDFSIKMTSLWPRAIGEVKDAEKL